MGIRIGRLTAAVGGLFRLHPTTLAASEPHFAVSTRPCDRGTNRGPPR